VSVIFLGENREFPVTGFCLSTRFYCSGLFYVFPTRNIVNFLINFTFLTATYFSEAQYSLFVLKVPLNPNQLINIPTRLLGKFAAKEVFAPLSLWQFSTMLSALLFMNCR